MNHWKLADTNYAYVKEHHCEVAVLPLGATEPHNLHLPYGTDTFQVEEIAGRACELAYGRGARVVMLPVIPYGTETNLMGFRLAINLNPSTLFLVLRDLIASLDRHGVHKLLILNGHGGNDLKPVLRELLGQTRVRLFLCDWFRQISSDLQAQFFDEPGDHAGEMETSLGLALFPHLVHTDPATGAVLADEGAVRATQFEAVNLGWVSISRPWHLLTTNSGCGDPHAASAEKGRQLFEGVVERLSEFLVQLDQAIIDDEFPY